MIYTERHARMSTDIAGHLPTLHSLVLDLDAKVIVECGVRGGQSTVALLEGAYQTEGHVTSVDIDPCVDTHAMIQAYGLSERWTFVQNDDVAFAEGWDHNRPLDLVFIDTSHLYEHTKKEIEVFEPLVRPYGFLVFHDTMSFPDGVLKPIEEFLRNKTGYHFENQAHNNGLGILRKRGP